MKLNDLDLSSYYTLGRNVNIFYSECQNLFFEMLNHNLASQKLFRDHWGTLRLIGILWRWFGLIGILWAQTTHRDLCYKYIHSTIIGTHIILIELKKALMTLRRFLKLFGIPWLLTSLGKVYHFINRYEECSTDNIIPFPRKSYDFSPIQFTTNIELLVVFSFYFWWIFRGKFSRNIFNKLFDKVFVTWRH